MLDELVAFAPPFLISRLATKLEEETWLKFLRGMVAEAENEEREAAEVMRVAKGEGVELGTVEEAVAAGKALSSFARSLMEAQGGGGSLEDVGCVTQEVKAAMKEGRNHLLAVELGYYDALREMRTRGEGRGASSSPATDIVGPSIRDLLSTAQRISLSTYGPPEELHARKARFFRPPCPQEAQWNASMLRQYAAEAEAAKREALGGGKEQKENMEVDEPKEKHSNSPREGVDEPDKFERKEEPKAEKYLPSANVLLDLNPDFDDIGGGEELEFGIEDLDDEDSDDDFY